jgi:hypothetical protein
MLDGPLFCSWILHMTIELVTVIVGGPLALTTSTIQYNLCY